MTVGGNVSSANGFALDGFADTGNLTITTLPTSTVSTTGAQNIAVLAASTAGGNVAFANTGRVIGGIVVHGGRDNVSIGGDVTYVGANALASAIAVSTNLSAKVSVAPNVTITAGYGIDYAGYATGVTISGSSIEADLAAGSKILASESGLSASGANIVINSAGVIGDAAAPPGLCGLCIDSSGAANVNVTGGGVYAAQTAVDITAGGAIGVSTGLGAALQGEIGLHAQSQAGPSAPVDVTIGGSVLGLSGDAVDANNAGGDITVRTTGGSNVRSAGSYTAGIRADTQANDGASLGNIVVAVAGNVSTPSGGAISTWAQLGNTSISVAASATISSGAGAGPAIYAAAIDGDIAIVDNGATFGSISGIASGQGGVSMIVNGNVFSSGTLALDPQGDGRVVVSIGPGVTVQSTLGWAVAGLGAGPSGYELDTAAGSTLKSNGQVPTIEITTGQFLLNNGGKLTSTGATYRTAINLHNSPSQGVPTTIATVNNLPGGVIDGQITVQSGSVTLNNAGIWDATWNSAFGASAGLGVVNNTGLIQVGVTTGAITPVASSITGLAAFNNGSSTATGTLSLVNGVVGDSLTVSGRFVGASGHSVLSLDAYLGGPGSAADQLHLLGGASGQTLIRINSTNKGQGAVNAQGIVLVTGLTASSNFALDPAGAGYDRKVPGIDQGLFLYSLAFQNNSEVLIGAPNGKAKQTPHSLAAGQSILDQTSFTDNNAGTLTFVNLADRPRAWMSASNGFTSDLQSQPALEALYKDQTGLASAPASAMRLSSVQSSGGYNTGYDLGISAVRGGIDLIRRNDEDKAFAFGLGMAYVQADQRFADYGTALVYSGAVFGAYGAYKAGALHIDGELKSEALSAHYLSSTLTAGDQPHTGLSSTGFNVNAGYAWRLGGHLTLEPVGSAAMQWTTMGDLTLEGAKVRFQPSLRAWANGGVTLKDEAPISRYRLAASLTGLLWDDFGSKNTAYLAALGPSSPMIDRLTGVSAEVRGAMTLSAGSFFSAYLQTSARAGAYEQEFTATTGLRMRW
jgi:hypothetical protein